MDKLQANGKISPNITLTFSLDWKQNFFNRGNIIVPALIIIGVLGSWLRCILLDTFSIEGLFCTSCVVIPIILFFGYKIRKNSMLAESNCLYTVVIGEKFVSCKINNYVFKVERDQFLRVRNGFFGTSVIRDPFGNIILVPDKIIPHKKLKEMLDNKEGLERQKLIEHSIIIIAISFLGSCLAILPEKSEKGILALLAISSLLIILNLFLYLRYIKKTKHKYLKIFLLFLIIVQTSLFIKCLTLSNIIFSL